MISLNDLKLQNEAPIWLLEEGYQTLCSGYLLPGETPRSMYNRVADAAASYCKNDKQLWRERFFDTMWRGWLCPATPVLTNMGTTRGLPISCNGLTVDDSLDSIFMKAHELAMLSKHGAGVSLYLGGVRGRGSPIKGNGVSEGIVPWSKLYDTTTLVANQGNVRRGASALYLPIEHPDAEEFIDIRRATGDINRRCQTTNHAVSISDQWMREMLKGDKTKRALWEKLLRTRFETGEPYIFFVDTVNSANPSGYVEHSLSVKSSNICTEVTLYTDPDHTFVCCLSSLNLTKWDEWKGTDLPAVAVRFLDSVLEEYIQTAKKKCGLAASVASAIKGRAIGIGVLGWHTLLQQRGLPFDSFSSMRLNAEVFKTIKAKADSESRKMGEELGVPLWGGGYRNSHRVAVAPTVSNSTIVGGCSAGVEPLAANIFVQKGATGSFVRKNATLESLLEQKGQNTPEVWKSITASGGSVQHLSFLSDIEKSVYLTAREINQHAIIKQAGQRAPFIDQSQSINLFFAANSDPKYIHEVHIAAWESGLKTLYYCRSDGVIRGDLASRSKDECKACEG